MRHAARLGATSLVLGCLVAAATPASGTGLLDAEIGAAHESNVNLAHLGRDKKSDSALTTAVSAGVALPLGDRPVKVWKLTLNPELRPRRSPVPGQRGYR